MFLFIGQETDDAFASTLGGMASDANAKSSWWEALVLWHSLLLIPDGEDPPRWGTAAMRRAPGVAEGNGTA